MDLESAPTETPSPVAINALRAVFVTGFLLLAGAAILVLRLAKPGLLTAILIERVQIVLFPLFFLALWFASAHAGAWIRRFLVFMALCGAANTGYSYLSIVKGSSDVLLISRLAGDGDESLTRVLRERIFYFLRFADSSVKPEQQIRTFTSDNEARALLSSRDHIDGVIWGNSRFINISLPDRAPIEIRSYGDLHLSPTVEQLEFVDSVPLTGLSYQPRESSAFFITKILEGMRAPVTSADAAGDELYRKQYAALHFGAEIATLHFSGGHRAYALWRAGTDSLKRFLLSGARERGYLECARADLKAADIILKVNENPELGAAILTNLAVIAAVKGDLDADPAALIRARKLFHQVNHTRRERDAFGVTFRAFQSALRNMRTIEGRNWRSPGEAKPKHAKGKGGSRRPDERTRDPERKRIERKEKKR